MVTFCQLEEGMVVGGHYRIMRFLGQGAMGAVYQAQDSNFDDYNRIVAVKLLPQELQT